ncbi:MAG: hypothetical protein JWQ87_5450 [Candidatus Sulfotelmatobacter sp.]|nr:hypothetical protein [Candidatus Sulfotelmatobacter sp.]
MAIAREHEAFEPGSEAFQTLNPGLLRSYAVDRVDRVNSDGIRLFANFQAGWQVLLNNLQAKCEGHTKARGYDGLLTPDSSLMDLTKTFRYLNVRRVVEFLKDALDDHAITELTKLSFFIIAGEE